MNRTRKLLGAARCGPERDVGWERVVDGELFVLDRRADQRPVAPAQSVCEFGGRKVYVFAAYGLTAHAVIGSAAAEVAAGHHHRRGREGVDVPDSEEGVEERREERGRQKSVE